VLRGRRGECKTLDRLLEAVQAGESRALVIRGEPGIGKSALLEYVAERASECQVARAAGVQSEMELAFAGLHQLCGRMVDRLTRLPEPQRRALETAFGLSPGEAAGPFLIGLALLSLLSEVAAQRALVCLVDDAQWLDRASVQALAFVARRVHAESVALVFAVREAEGDQQLPGVPELQVAGLGDGDARVLLESALRGPLDEGVRDRIVAETRGNPLALLELPRAVTPAALAGGFALPGARPLSDRIEESFRHRLEALPADTQCLLLVAAAEPAGDPMLAWRAAERLGIGFEAAAPAATAGLCEFGTHVRFRHPLVRSAVYGAASAAERRSVHHALAEAIDREADPDRRAWHRAEAATGPDEAVAEELERSAGRAQARGGMAAAAAFLEQATVLTPDVSRRAERALAAARAKLVAGAPEAALQLVATAQAGRLDELQRARVDLLRAEIAFTVNRGSDAPPLLLSAAKRLEAHDATLARETYLEALSAAMFAGRLATGGGLLAVAGTAGAAPPPTSTPRAADLLLDGLAVLFREGYGAGTPILKQALAIFGSEDISVEEELRWLWIGSVIALDLWDDETWRVLSGRHVQLARDTGALAVLPLALSSRIFVHLYAGELTEAASLVAEVRTITEATGTNLTPYGALALAAWRGQEAETSQLMQASLRDAELRSEGIGLTVTHWVSAVLDNALGRYESARAAAAIASEHVEELGAGNWALIELVEASVRSGTPESAADALGQLAERTRASGSDWALGIEARSRALLSDGETAEALYREAIERLGRTRIAVHHARAHLVYGEWLRRERRRLDARQQLRTAHAMFAAMGMVAFAERAARELLATGETARKRTVETSGELTAQEAQIARLAGKGLSNPEIGGRLFISPRTVEYHLHKVFTKLDITSRDQLDRVRDAEPV
jgi:DNA-binding CsgD family transcriptional regulator